jgi:hypothetical protein
MYPEGTGQGRSLVFNLESDWIACSIMLKLPGRMAVLEPFFVEMGRANFSVFP